MSRLLLAAVLVLGLLLAISSIACANPWPNYSSSGAQTYPFSVSTTAVSGGYDYDLTMSGSPADTLREFIVYYSGVSTASPPVEHSTGYDGGNTAGFTSLNGGWEYGNMGTPDSVALGWKIANGGEVAPAGNYQFRVRNLPTDFVGTPHFVIHYGSAETGLTYYAQEDGRPPNETPEPGTIALLTLGLGAVTGVIRRRKSS